MEETNQVVRTIQQLLERMVIPLAQSTPRLRSTVEGPRVEQQVAKAITHGNATSTCHTNSQQVSRSQAESTRSATTVRRRRDEVGPSRPQNITALGRTTRPNVIVRSWEREITKDALRPSCNVFN